MLRHGYEDRLDIASQAMMRREDELVRLAIARGPFLCSECGERFSGDPLPWVRVGEEPRRYCSWLCLHAARDGGA